MTKDEMRAELRFPLYGPRIFEMTGLEEISHNKIVVNAWIMCVVRLTNGTSFWGIYKWQKEKNPSNICSYCYINIDSISGPVRYVEYEHITDDNVILLVDELQKDLLITPS